MVGSVNYPYYLNLYNSVFSERVIELPYVYTKYHDLIKRRKKIKVLEVGNVLSHYFNVSNEVGVSTYDVIDKYERADNTINVDITKFRSRVGYDIIISISTLEHIGFDEEEKDDKKPLKALNRMISLLNPEGVLIATMPLGYNPTIDQMLSKGKIGFDETHFIRRVSRTNNWEETDLNTAKKYPYNLKYPCANAVAFLVYKRKGRHI
jgi:hypothetical protein